MTLVVLTNDDGIDSPGIVAMADALKGLCRIAVLAPEENQSAVSHSITLRKNLHVRHAPLDGVDRAYAVSGTPADCVRLATLGIFDEAPDLVVSGANLGLNLGDDIAYSGTVAAALEAAYNGIPALAVSQQTTHGELGFPQEPDYDFRLAQLYVAGLTERILAEGPNELHDMMMSTETPHDDPDEVAGALSSAMMLNINVPGIHPQDARGVRITKPSRRFYKDTLSLQSEQNGTREYSIYGHEPGHCERPDTDATALSTNHISVTPVRQRFDDERMRELLGGLDVIHHGLPD